MQSVEHPHPGDEVNEEANKRQRVDPSASATPELSAISAIASMSTMPVGMGSMNEYTAFSVDLPGTEKPPGEEDDAAKTTVELSPKQLAKQRKREKDRVRAHQKRVQYREQTSELKRLREQVSAGMNEHGIAEIIGVIKELLGEVEMRDMAGQLRTLGTVVRNSRDLIAALPHNSDLRRPITKWLVRNLSPSEACRALGLSRASYYRAFHSKEDKLMANASGYHHKRHHTTTLEDSNETLPTTEIPEPITEVVTSQPTEHTDAAHALGVTEHPEQVEQPTQTSEHTESMEMPQMEY